MTFNTSLTEAEITTIFDWLNSWEQLKGTAIPLRFKEEFGVSEKIINPGQCRPPIGIKPKWLHDQDRKNEIKEAILRYMNADMKVPPEWIKELNESSKYLP